jgi:hypothetical protein
VLTNCIVYDNVVQPDEMSDNGSTANSTGCTMRYCCSYPLPAGTGNIGADPQLLADGVHLPSTSPCVSAGASGVSTGTDIYGNAWSNPPSMGCEQWTPAPGILGQPVAQAIGSPPALSIGVTLLGQPPFGYWWFMDGAPLTNGGRYDTTVAGNLTVVGFGPADAGSYQLVLSNAFGLATSAVQQVVVHCVDAAGTGPAAPYSDWTTAATGIQDAIDAAGSGDFVLVTNGIYSTGGKAISGTLTNRVALDQPVWVAGVNGPAQTVIQGAWDPNSTNGPLAVRCAWVGPGATLEGFTLRGGATQLSGGAALQCGGGVLGAGSNANALVLNCVLTGNAASSAGGGCAQAQLTRCQLLQNQAPYGGGAFQAVLVNSIVRSNSATQLGGGVYETAALGSLLESNAAQFGGGAASANLYNCTVIDNVVEWEGGGIYNTFAANSIIEDNSLTDLMISPWIDYYSENCTLAYSCTDPGEFGNPPPGNGDLYVNAQLLNDFYLAVNSPCRGAGSPLYASGTDIDGQPWASPPSMGCSEVWPATITGPLSVSASLAAEWPVLLPGEVDYLLGQVTGRASQVTWSFGDGSVLTNASYLTLWHIWTNPGDYTVTFTAFNADNPAGVSTNISVQIVPLAAPAVLFSTPGDTNFTLSFSGQAGAAYVVQWTASLTPPVTWQTLTTLNCMANEALQATDPIAITNSARYYRVYTYTQP